MRFDLALIQWPDPGEGGGARLIGRVDDHDLVDEARRRIVERRRADLAELERDEIRPQLHVVAPSGGGADGD